MLSSAADTLKHFGFPICGTSSPRNTCSSCSTAKQRRDWNAHLAPELARQVPLEELETPSQRVEKPATPEELTRAKQLQAELLVGLEPADQKLMQLLIEGYTLPEISSRLDLTYGNAAVRLHRLRVVLRKYMQDKGL